MKKTLQPSPKNRINTTLKMTEGSPYKLMCRFALPILLSHIFQQLYNTADAFIVGRFLGTEALAAVSSSGTLIFLMISFFGGMSMGGGVIISRYFGGGEDEKVSRAIHTTILLGLFCGLFLTVVGVAFTPTLLVWMNTDPDVLPEAIEYFRYYFLGSIPMIMYNMCNSTLNAVGDSRRPLYYLITSSLINIVLDVLFVGIFHWGVWAAAAATVIAQGTSLVLSLSHLMKKGNVFTVEIRKLRIHGDMLREILRYGLPSGVQNSVIALANVVVQSQINSFGKLAMAAYGTHAKIEGFAFLPITSFNMATTTFISQNLGARNYERAKKGARFGIIAAVILAEIIGVLCYTFAPKLIGLFDSNPGVIELGALQSRTVSLFFFLLAFSHSVASVCRGAGKAFVPMIIMLAVWCGIRIAYIITVMHVFGEIRFIYWAYPLTWAISSVIYLIYYLCSDWVHGFEKKSKASL
ncbi:MAG: MATE family efflux transporter [Oscillospiraceae bacterium]|nr:MATE family efflux transporter [Oscillospiraceae bacterium]